MEALLLKPEGPSSGFMTIHSAEAAVAGTYPFKVECTGLVEGKRVTRKGEPLSGDAPVRDAFLTVQPSTAPFTLDLLTLSLLLEQDQTGTVHVQLQRRAGFDGEIKLSAEGYSAGRESLGRNVDVTGATLKAGETHGTLSLKARLDSEIGSRLVYVKGEATVDGQVVTQLSQSMPLTLQQIPFTLLNTVKKVSVAVLPAGNKSAASEAEFTIKASRRGWFTDQINLSLEGLPEGVSVTSTNLASQVREVTYRLATTDKAPADKDFQVTVVGSATAGGRTYEQRTAPMALSITKPQDLAEAK